METLAHLDPVLSPVLCHPAELLDPLPEMTAVTNNLLLDDNYYF